MSLINALGLDTDQDTSPQAILNAMRAEAEKLFPELSREEINKMLEFSLKPAIAHLRSLSIVAMIEGGGSVRASLIAQVLEFAQSHLELIQKERREEEDEDDETPIGPEKSKPGCDD